MKGSAKAASGRKGEATAGPPELPVSEDDRRIRALILAELDRHRVRPVARRTLALIAEGFVEPAGGVPGYRIVDRAGTVRLRGEAAGGVPLSLPDLIEELSAQHPALFLPAPPPAEPPEPARDPIADVRAAGARFVETQSALARSLASSSAERSRALASAASETVEGWRSRLAARLKARPRPAAEGAGPDALPAGTATAAAGPSLSARLKASAGSLSGRLRPRETAARLREIVEDGLAAGGRRPVVLIGLGAAAGAALVAGLALNGRDSTRTGGAERPAAEARAPQAPPAAETPPPEEPAPDAPPTELSGETETRPPEAEPPARPAANAIVGVPEVIDTATLRVAGKVVRLFGVEWVRGGQAGDLTKYLRGRSVTCQPAPGSSAHVCTVEGRDLSEVVLFNGGGRASAEATPELAAAEDHARSERLGVWKR